MTFPSELTHEIDNLMRGDLQAFRDGYFEWLLYSTYLVIAGVALEGPEVLHDGINLFRKPDTERKAPKWVRFVALLGWVFIVVGVAGEAYFDGKVSDGDTQIQNFNTSLLLEAELKGTSAERYAGSAILFAGEASDSARKATDSAGQSEALAQAARREADSFEKDIVSAKEQAANAERDLAEARRQAAEAMSELYKIKAPRSFDHVPLIVGTLAEFKGTEYVFSSVGADEDSLRVLKDLDRFLQGAGWKRGNPPPTLGAPAINVFGSDVQYPVVASLTDGIRISVDLPEEFTLELERLPPDKLPMPLKAARALWILISQRLSPPEKYPHPVDVLKGDSKTVRISVGKKP